MQAKPRRSHDQQVICAFSLPLQQAVSLHADVHGHLQVNNLLTALRDPSSNVRTQVDNDATISATDRTNIDTLPTRIDATLAQVPTACGMLISLPYGWCWSEI